MKHALVILVIASVMGILPSDVTSGGMFQSVERSPASHFFNIVDPVPLTAPALVSPGTSVTGTLSVPSQLSFAGLASMSDRRWRHNATRLPDGRVMFAGGSIDEYNWKLRSIEIYDPSTYLVAKQHSLTASDVGDQAVLLDDGSVLLLGSYNTQLYQVLTDKIRPSGHFVTERSGYSVVPLTDGRVLVAGGKDSNSSEMSSAELYDPASGLFQTAGSMRTPRSGHTATLLDNEKVLIAGGYRSGAGYLKSAELYDPVTGVSASTGGLSYARSGHTATRLSDGRVLMVGGSGDGSATGEVYDPTTGTFTQASSSLYISRAAHTATLLADGRVLICGAAGGGPSGPYPAELYDPTTNQFLLTGGTSDWRTVATATLLSDGTVLVAGGGGNHNQPVRSMEIYVPANGTFRSPGTLIARSSHTSTNLPDGSVLITGGYTYQGAKTNSAEIYNPTENAFSPVGNLLQGRVEHTASPLADGRVLVAGGVTSSGYTGASELYDPATQMFSTASDLQQARAYHVATVLSDGSVLVCGGVSAGGSRLASCERYDPSHSAFAITGSMGAPRNRHTMTLLTDGRVLVAGGADNSVGALAQAELYDPTTGIFTPTGSLNAAREGHTATLLADGRVMVAGGSSAGGFLATVEIYDPETGNFTLSEQLLSTPHYDHTATPLSDGTILLAGVYDQPSATISAETVHPLTGATVLTARLYTNRSGHGAALLPNGNVLLTGGYVSLNEQVLNSAELGLFLPSNTFTGTLEVPTTWVGAGPITLTVTGVTSGSPVIAAALSLDGVNWGPWFSLAPGKSVTATIDLPPDGPNQLIYLRLKDELGQEATVATASVSLDSEAPTGSIIINDGGSFTNTLNVTLHASASDGASGISQMQFSNDDVIWSAWQPYATTATWQLTPGDGTKTIHARYRDHAGNTSIVATASVSLDSEAPTGSSIINDGGSFTNTLNVTLHASASDGASGISQMQFSNDDVIWSAWQPYATTATWQLTPGDGTKTVHARYRDHAGNTSIVATTTILLDQTPPVGTVALSPDTMRAGTFPRTVTLHLTAVDGLSGIGVMQVSNDAGFAGSTWQFFAHSLDWDLKTGVTAYVRYSDVVGNISNVYSATLQLTTIYSTYLPNVVR